MCMKQSAHSCSLQAERRTISPSPWLQAERQKPVSHDHKTVKLFSADFHSKQKYVFQEITSKCKCCTVNRILYYKYNTVHKQFKPIIKRHKLNKLHQFSPATLVNSGGKHFLSAALPVWTDTKLSSAIKIKQMQFFVYSGSHRWYLYPGSRQLFVLNLKMEDRFPSSAQTPVPHLISHDVLKWSWSRLVRWLLWSIIALINSKLPFVLFFSSSPSFLLLLF